MLWEKELCPVTVAYKYVDLFASIAKKSIEEQLRGDEPAIEIIEANKKCNRTSTKYRLEGDAEFTAGKWQLAMRRYNLSLRQAEVGSENVALAYAKRSKCFLELGMFHNSIADIDLALSVPNVPENLKLELGTRRSSLLSMQKAEEKSAPKLDFPAANDFHPGMANVMEMKYDFIEFGRHFVANCDIDAGKVIVVEEAFVNGIAFGGGANICDTCFAHMKSFVACQRCTLGLFCNDYCSADKLHKLRCGRRSEDDDGLIETAVRSIDYALSIFPTVRQLISFVEVELKDSRKGKGVPDSLVDKESKYRLFLSLYKRNTMNDDELIEKAYEVFKVVMQHPPCEAVFSTEKKRRFLMHLCAYHTNIAVNHTFDGATGGIFLLKSHFNHSCAPNVLTFAYENKSVCVTSRRITKGEQLFITFDTDYFDPQPRAERRFDLYQKYNFKCRCEKCGNVNWPISSNTMKLDPEFQLLAELDLEKIDPTDSALCAMWKQKSMDMLIKYGDHPWTTQKDVMAKIYQRLSVETWY